MQSEKFTYVGKYGCQKEYMDLKSCMKDAEPSQIKLKCDKHYEIIGSCILEKFKKSY